MLVRGLHHAAYRCRDAKRTTEFYTRHLGLDFEIAVAENYVPSTGEWSPHIHIFFAMGTAATWPSSSCPRRRAACSTTAPRPGSSISP